MDNEKNELKKKIEKLESEVKDIKNVVSVYHFLLMLLFPLVLFLNGRFNDNNNILLLIIIGVLALVGIFILTMIQYFPKNFHTFTRKYFQGKKGRDVFYYNKDKN